MNAHQLHPHSAEAERALLGGLLRDPSQLETIALRAEDFFDDSHRHLWQLMRTMKARGEVVDIVTMPERVMRAGAARFGGVGYVIDLPDHAATTANLTHYAAEVGRMASYRRLMSVGSDMVKAASSKADDPALLVERYVAEVRASAGSLSDDTVAVGDSIECGLEVLMAAEGRDGLVGMDTGVDAVNELIGGLERKSYTVLGGRPGHGKTGLALQLLLGCAMNGHRGHFDSLEMPLDRLTARLIGILANLDPVRVRTGTLRAEDWGRIEGVAAPRLRELPITINDKSGRTGAEIVATARARHAREGMDLYMLDYLQLVDVQGKRTRTEEIGDVSKSMKALAKDCNVATVALAQLSRESAKRGDPRPKSVDLRDSGQIEQDADAILFVHRPSEYDPQLPNDRAEIVKTKFRHGEPSGVVEVEYQAGRFGGAIEGGGDWFLS